MLSLFKLLPFLFPFFGLGISFAEEGEGEGSESANQPSAEGLPEGQSPEEGLGGAPESGSGEAPSGEEGEGDFSFIPEDVPEDLLPHLAEAEKRMKSAFNKKMTELAEKYRGKKVVASFDDLLNDKEFVDWARKKLESSGFGQGQTVLDPSKLSMDEAVSKWNQMTQEQRTIYYTRLDPTQREIFKLRLQLNQKLQEDWKRQEDAAFSEASSKYGEPFIQLQDKIKALRAEIYQYPYLTPEEAFKILDYEAYGERKYKEGLAQGEKNVKEKKGSSIPSGKKGVGAPGVAPRKVKSMREAYELAEKEIVKK